MKKNLLLSFVLMLTLLAQVAAQSRAVSGRVTDRQNGQGLPGVTVLLKGTTNGASTNADGSYTITVPAEGGTLIFSSIGYASVERSIGTESVVNMGLALDTKQLGEVVVTAFGIEREAKTLTYAVQQVSGEAVTRVGQPNVTNALQGKVAGVVVRQSSGMPGASSLITVRGSRSFTDNNQPLYVVDGMPIESNPAFAVGFLNATVGAVSGPDQSSRALDINPEDIESISVLKGGAATALYGLRASNGVVVITTKKGQGQRKPVLSYSTNVSFDKVSVLPDLQSTYAQGTGGTFSQNTSTSWGPRLTELDPTVLDKGGKPLVPGKVYDNVEPLFRTGHTLTNAVDLIGGGDYGNFAIGLAYTRQKGIIPQTGLDRYNAKVAGDYAIGKKVRVGASANYADTYIDKLPGGSNLSNPLFTTYYAPRSYDLWGIPFEDPTNPNIQIHYRAAIDNPRWSLAHNRFNERTHRVFGNTNVSYKPLEFLTFNYRLGLDYFTTEGHEFYDLGSGNTGGRTPVPAGGQITNYAFTQNQVNSNASLTFDKNVTEDIGLILLVGNEFYDIRDRLQTLIGNGVTIGGLENIDNTVTQNTAENINRRRVVGFYGNVNVSWRELLFLNGSARQDYVSNLPRGNRTFFYPSIGLGLVLTEAVKLPDNIISFAKLRGSYAQVGQQPDAPYSTRNIYLPGGSASGYLTDGIVFPFNGVAALTQSDILRSNDLKPQNTNTLEFGTDLRFLKNRVTFDYTYFIQKSKNQIFQVPTAFSTGYTSRLTNAGSLETKGHELTVAVKPVQTKTIVWTLGGNFTSYRNRVLALAEGVDNIFLGGFTTPNVRAQAGANYPILFGVRYARTPDGQIIVDEDGYPTAADDSGPLGNVQPNYDMGLSNTIEWKGLALSAQVDIRRGGVAYAGNTKLAKLYGIDAQTEDRESDYIFPGVKAVTDAGGTVTGYVPNDIVIQRDENYWRNVLDPIDESHVYSTDFVRLREIALSYTLPAALVTKTKVLQSASISLTGRNLALWTDYPNFDPETNVGGAGNGQGVEYVSLPQTRSYGASLRVSF
ncbi:SusC/RagA family TonB-linked outer membrane protein [Hymenobacter lucidus]|uniref:SusC/RagA family TonB-linked outer membrane protein n=1 Tax=Hymenobacter lucidus TaxID=2880930 RepID=A0ABS8APB0_9BACT|nr:SusC/RagA family TonB-linked outer membrane protein [Hymenobacter lucidus]MCB2408037.1 SusC/RagA family TonB-linked outer membrane protein [Hymenobacter lucidus]